MGEGIGEIRLPNDAGIAGECFFTRKTINIQHAYADLRFNPNLIKKLDTLLNLSMCTDTRNKQSEVIGCTQVLNRWGGKVYKRG